jgi:cytochrome c-type biogenesis protein CcmE
MTQLTWEKTTSTEKAKNLPQSTTERLKFMVGGVVLLAAVVYLVIAGMSNNTQYFMTVDELLGDPSYVGKTVRISGAVLGETIQYQMEPLAIDFVIASIPKETSDLARTLHEATLNPNAQRLTIHIENQVKPDLLENEAQAILTGHLGEDGIFYATELLLKCPSRYEEDVPDQAVSQAQ